MAWYSLGTVSVVLGSTAVTGTGTNFAAGARNGDAFLGPDGKWYEIVNIVGETVLSISPAYLGATNATGTYSIVPVQGYVKESADILRSITTDLTDRLIALDNLDATELAALDGITGPIQAQLDNKLEGTAAYVLGRVNHTGLQAQNTVSNLVTDLAGKQPLAAVLTGTTASYTVAEATKLGGIATLATKNNTDAFLVARANHTGTQAQSSITNLTTDLAGKQPLNAFLTGTTASYTSALDSKLGGIQFAATYNSSDSFLLNRVNHTGTQSMSSISGLTTALADKVPITAITTATTASFTTALQSKLNTIPSAASANQTDAYLLSRANHTGTQAQSTIAGLVSDLAGKQATLISGTSIKTLNNISLLGAGNIAIDNIVLNGIQTINGKSGENVTLFPVDIGAATSAQGTLANTAVQPAALTAAINTRATQAQGNLADTALQPGAIEASTYIKRIRTLALAAL